MKHTLVCAHAGVPGAPPAVFMSVNEASGTEREVPAQAIKEFVHPESVAYVPKERVF